jgi:anti-sigma factor RsiW
MKTFEENFTAWVDGKLPDDERLEFESALGDEAGIEKARLLMMGTLLRRHSPAPPLANADFFNHQLLERIAREEQAAPRPRRTAWFVPRFLWAGASSLAAAALLFHFLIPVGPQVNPAPSNEYMAQFNNVRSTDPAVTATAFHSKKDNVTVLWLDGLDYLPETADLK